MYGNDYPILKLRQIEEHNKVKDVEKKEARLEQDARIEAENNFRSEQQLAKDRRIREQKAYRDFLFVQMNERKARENHKVPFIYCVFEDFRTFSNPLTM